MKIYVVMLKTDNQCYPVEVRMDKNEAKSRADALDDENGHAYVISCPLYMPKECITGTSDCYGQDETTWEDYKNGWRDIRETLETLKAKIDAHYKKVPGGGEL